MNRPSRAGTGLAWLGILAVACAAVAVALRLTSPPMRHAVPLVAGTSLRGFNRLTVSITVCEPGTDTCATIDHVMVDTGSTGLRLDRAALPAEFRLPVLPGPQSQPLAECLRFGDGTAAWGGLYGADFRIGSLRAPDLPVQLFEDDAPNRAGDCPQSKVTPTSNGTLGVSAHLTDCFGRCDQTVWVPLVYGCAEAACTPLRGAVAPEFRLPNPLTRLDAGRINGLIFDLPPLPPGGARTLTGTLTFGIDAGALAGARILRLNERGAFTTRYDGRTLPASYIDSGTGTYTFANLRLPACIRPSWAFCISPPQELQAVMVGEDGTEIPMGFRVGDYNAELTSGNTVSDRMATIAAQDSQAFVWGAPFFMGKRVFLVPEGASVLGTGTPGPFYAFEK